MTNKGRSYRPTEIAWHVTVSVLLQNSRESIHVRNSFILGIRGGGLVGRFIDVVAEERDVSVGKAKQSAACMVAAKRSVPTGAILAFEYAECGLAAGVPGGVFSDIDGIPHHAAAMKRLGPKIEAVGVSSPLTSPTAIVLLVPSVICFNFRLSL